MNRLASLNGKRGKFQGIFERFGVKQSFAGWPTRTVLLVDVCDTNGELICDHFWFAEPKGFRALKLKSGDAVSFVGRITEHGSRYKGFRERFHEPEYKISFPSNFTKRVSTSVDDLPLFAGAKNNKP